MKHLKRYNESDESMQYYVDNYLSYVNDSGKYTISVSKNSVTLRTKDGECVSMATEPDILTFIDMLASKYEIDISYWSPDVDGITINRGATYKIISNRNIYFSLITIYIKPV